MKSRWLYLVVFGLLTLCAACSSDPELNDGANLSLQPPALVLAARQVDREQLTLTVAVGGEQVEMTEADNGTWSGSVDLTPSTAHQFVVSWHEFYNDQDLLLARAIKSFQVPEGDSAQVSFRNNEFNTSFDNDSDGRSNLSERTNNSDPYDPSSPAAPPTEVAVEIQIFLSNDLQNIDGITENLEMVAFVNSQTLPITREAGRWVGGTSLTENSEAFLDAQLFSDSSRAVRLGLVRKSTNVGNGGIIILAAEEFDFMIDSDGDSISNKDELITGSDPLDSNSPMPDPCQPTDFVAGCPTDSDGDGETDFQETETRDSDGDTIPDYLESLITDADGDGLSAQEDIDDTDACIPDPDAPACTV